MSGHTRLFLLPLILLIGAGVATADEVISLTTRGDVTQSFLLLKPEKPISNVILFAGGHGNLDLSQGAFGPVIGWGKNNFVVRTREKYRDRGFVVAVVDAPSDHHGKKGMKGGFRDSSEHTTDIKAVAEYLKKLNGLRVWVIGTSRGTESATRAAIDLPGTVDGVVLTSSVSVPNKQGTAVTEMALGKITQPTLITAHRNDGCSVCPPSGAEEIKRMLVHARVAEVRYFDGGDSKSDPCEAMSHHGYLGIDDSVVKSISDFIIANTAPIKR